jgi:hypothetical protein
MSLANPTLEDVWQLFRETDRKFQEQSKETERRFQETERFLKEQSKETERFLKEQSQETDRKFQETERLLREQAQKTSREISKVTKAVGELSNRLGEFVENSVRPAAVQLFQKYGIAVHEVHTNVSVQRDNEGLEIDLLVVNDTDVIVIECKSKLSVEHIQEHVERLNKVKRLMPKYANTRILGAVASMVLTDSIINYAYRQGLFVLAQSGDAMVIRNDINFKPKEW